MSFPINRTFRGVEEEPVFLKDDKSLISSWDSNSNRDEINHLNEIELISSRIGKRTFQSSLPTDPCSTRSYQFNWKYKSFNQRDESNEKNEFFDDFSINCQIENIYQNIESLRKNYKSFKQGFQEYGSFQGVILGTGEYFSINKENILKTILTLAPDKYGEAEIWLNKYDSGYKWTDCTTPLIASVYKYHKICGIQEKLIEYEGLYQKLLILNKRSPFNFKRNKQIQKIHKAIEKFKSKLEKHKIDAFDKGIWKFARFTTKLSLESIERFTSISAKIANKVSKCTFHIFKSIQEIKRVLYARSLQKEWLYTLQPRIAVNVYPKTEEQISKKKEEQNSNIDQSLPFIMDHIHACQNMEFSEIQTHFAKQLHIDINSIDFPHHELRTPPTTKLEWQQCIQNEKFCKALAKQWVEFQETTAQLVTQALRQALLSKNHLEHKFLSLRLIQYSIGIASALLQLILFSPLINLFALSSILEFLITDISKLGIPGASSLYIFYPIYPEFNFKLDSIFMLLAEYLFAIQYKPHEYSFESYHLTIQIRMIKLNRMVRDLLFLAQQFLLWLNIRLIENCIMRIEKKPIIEDDRYIQMQTQYEQYRSDCKQRLKELKNCLDQLVIQDTKQILYPQPDELGLKVDFIQDLVKTLKDANIDYFPSEARKFFKKHVGLKLKNKNKDRLETHLQEFFSRSEYDFVCRK